MREREVRILGRTFHLEWGRIARQADGAVMVREGETVVLVSAVADAEPRQGVDFFPLTVEYRERFSAVGRFPGGYRKREGQASNHEILTSRLIDRSIRPLFPDGFHNETQVIATVLAKEPDGDPGVLAILGAAAALQISDIPWNGPVAGMRIGRAPEGGWIGNPTQEERQTPTLDLLASFHPEGLVMLEGGARELPEAEIIDALSYGQEKLKPLLHLLVELRDSGKPKRPFDPPTIDPDIASALREVAGEDVRRAVTVAEKQARRQALHEARARAAEALRERFGDREKEIEAAFEERVYEALRSSILDEERRADGRGLREIRPISCEVGWLPRVHGSALFTRGETQSIAVCTLGTGQDEQEVEGLEGVERETFQLYYRFPPYSVGEVRPVRAPGRREIGHGALARRALAAVLPARERFPYTIKVESEISESNGSSSMASVCGGCLCLMDAGVPIHAPVAGIAMGLVRDGERTAILSDILGDEDHLGDMDFKVAGTGKGITALQLDNKIGSVPIDLLAGALDQARSGRLHILAEMAKALREPRPHLAPHAPRIASTKIPTYRIRDLIGSGGRVIQDLQADTSTRVDVSDDGTVRVYAQSEPSLEMAMKRIRDLTGEPEVGKYYRGTVTGVKEFGAFVRLFEGIEGLVHASELAPGEVRSVSSIAHEGDEMIVKVLGVDPNGKIRLSRKQAIGVPASEIAND
ncbi:MAG: polyribonucleotide nucleotidyltransferase [Candidatus Eisenbacteria bacterium]